VGIAEKVFKVDCPDQSITAETYISALRFTCFSYVVGK